MLTQEKLKTHLFYDPDTGDFTRIAAFSNSAKVGDTAGTVVDGYVRIGISGIIYKAHRLVWLYMYNKWPNNIDHINHNRSDNRLKNLRDVSHIANSRNKSIFKSNTSKITGVHWAKRDKVWLARITINYKKISLGSFCNIFDAACARKSAERKHGFHKNHGS